MYKKNSANWQRIKVFCMVPQKIVTNLSEIPGLGYRIRKKIYPKSWIRIQKQKKAPDPGSATLVSMQAWEELEWYNGMKSKFFLKWKSLNFWTRD